MPYTKPAPLNHQWLHAFSWDEKEDQQRAWWDNDKSENIYRPLLIGERCQDGDQYAHGTEGWCGMGKTKEIAKISNCLLRTKRPVPKDNELRKILKRAQKIIKSEAGQDAKYKRYSGFGCGLC